MTNLYGPWATAINVGGNAQLSSFWRQRLTMLVPASQTSPVLSRRNLLGLVAAAVLICALPTFHAAPAVAEQEKAANKSEASQPPAAKPDANTKMVGGKVIDENGKPVAGAEVWLGLEHAAKVHVVHAKADSQGRFALQVPSAWLTPMHRWEKGGKLWGFAVGHQLAATDLLLPGDGSDIAIQLGPATDTSFVVLDPEQRPCKGALVEPLYLPEELQTRVGARTDAEGRAKLPALSFDVRTKVRVTTPDFGIQLQYTEKRNPLAIAEQTIYLKHVGRIEGRLVAAQPEIVRGVRVVLTTGGVGPPTMGYADVESDEHGRFVVPMIAAGELQIDEIGVGEKQPLRPKLPEFGSVEVQAGKTTRFQIPMVPTVVVRGSIRTKETGRPIPGAWIFVGYGVKQSALPVSDAEGKFTARVLPGPGNLHAINLPENYVHYVELGNPGEQFYEVPKNVKGFDLPPLEFVPGKTIAGRVIDQHGRAIADLSICVTEGDAHYGFDTSDKNGHFKLTGVPATFNPAKLKYECKPQDILDDPGGMSRLASWSTCKVLKTEPLVLRAIPIEPPRYYPEPPGRPAPDRSASRTVPPPYYVGPARDSKP